MGSQHHCQGTLLPVSTHHETRVCRALPRDTNDEYRRPDGLNEQEQREWDAMMEDPAVHDLFYGMGSSGQGGGERPANAPEKPLTSQEVAQMVKMGSWRVGPWSFPRLSSWKYAYLDTMDPKGEGRMSHNIPDPSKEDAAWPRMQIENRVYESYCFRKLHIEVAVKQDGMQVLHLVMYPRTNFSLPIVSMDLVAFKGTPTLAIIDPCPVTSNLTLPPLYAKSVQSLQDTYNVATNRGIPDWGRDIFSPLCILLRPTSPEDMGGFLKYTLALINFHLQFARLATPLEDGSRTIQEIEQAHIRYCAKQLENDKTRRVLATCFGTEVADDYMDNFMFDHHHIQKTTKNDDEDNGSTHHAS
eukprot:jgi/Picre1/30281/NNA_005645.t1